MIPRYLRVFRSWRLRCARKTNREPLPTAPRTQLPSNQRLHLSGAVISRKPSSCGLVRSSPAGEARGLAAAPSTRPMVLLMRWKVRALWAASMLAFGAVLIGLAPGRNDPRGFIFFIPVALSYLASRYWPRCPHCGARVIRSYSDWLDPGSECPDCEQQYDGPRRSRPELSIGRLPFLVDQGIISSADATALATQLREEVRLRVEAPKNQRAGDDLLRLLEDQLPNQRRVLDGLTVGRQDPGTKPLSVALLRRRQPDWGARARGG